MILDEIAPREEFTISQLYQKTPVSEYRLYKAIREKELPAYRKYGTGAWIILGSDFIDWYTNGHYAKE